MDEWVPATVVCRNEACPKVGIEVPNIMVPTNPEEWNWQGVKCGVCDQWCEVLNV